MLLEEKSNKKADDKRQYLRDQIVDPEIVREDIQKQQVDSCS